MADQKISELVNISIGDIDSADEFVIADTSANDNKAITWGELAQNSDTDTTSGRLLKVGAFGLGGSASVISDADNSTITEFRGVAPTTTNSLTSGASGAIMSIAFSNIVMQLHLDGGRAGFRRIAGGVPGTWNELWSTFNTTVDGSGFLLEASPIVRLYTDAIEEPNEAVGATLEHPATGVYVLRGAPPLATEGWQVRTPEDLNGNKVVAIGQPEYDASAETLTIRTYDLLWENGRLVPGDPMDIPGDYFVMLRFEGESDEV